MALFRRVLRPSLSYDILSHFCFFVQRSEVGAALSCRGLFLRALQIPFKPPLFANDPLCLSLDPLDLTFLESPGTRRASAGTMGFTKLFHRTLQGNWKPIDPFYRDRLGVGMSFSPIDSR